MLVLAAAFVCPQSVPLPPPPWARHSPCMASSSPLAHAVNIACCCPRPCSPTQIRTDLKHLKAKRSKAQSKAEADTKQLAVRCALSCRLLPRSHLLPLLGSGGDPIALLRNTIEHQEQKLVNLTVRSALLHALLHSLAHVLRRLLRLMLLDGLRRSHATKLLRKLLPWHLRVLRPSLRTSWTASRERWRHTIRRSARHAQHMMRHWRR